MQNQQIRIEHTFSQTGLDPFICRLLSHKKYKNPTPIQYFSIKTGIDHPELSLICRSKSGTGKTIAYISLLINFFLSLHQIEEKTYSIILLPTRQLAVQVYQTLKQILDYTGQVKAFTQNQKQMKKKICDLSIMLTIGGISFEDDRKKYRQNASKIIICTVGRIWEMIKSNIIIMGKEMLIIFDEGDKLLSNVDQKLNKVISMVPKSAKWLVYSATYSNKIISDIAKVRKCMYVQTIFKNNELDVVITDKILDIIQSNPNLLPETLPQHNSTAQYEENHQNSENLHLLNIKKYQIMVTPEQNDSIFDSKIKKLSELLSQLQYQKCLIFVEKKSFLQQISQNLNNFEHVLIHGSLSQAARFRMMNQINNTKIIIASDLLSRGIDIKLDLVILFDAKQSDTFWHRIGRTGRYGRTGVAISLDQIQDKQWIQFDKEEVNNILFTIELQQKKQWYGGHLTEIGKWQQFDEQKQAKNNYKYFDESKMESRIKQISKIEQEIGSGHSGCEQKSGSVFQMMEKAKNAKSKIQLQNLLKQIISCKHCKELMKATTELTGYQFQILSFVQERN